MIKFSIFCVFQLLKQDILSFFLGSQLDVKMSQLSSSNKPGDTATLAYIGGFPLVTMKV
jgi:hypothetical protein